MLYRKNSRTGLLKVSCNTFLALAHGETGFMKPSLMKLAASCDKAFIWTLLERGYEAPFYYLFSISWYQEFDNLISRNIFWYPEIFFDIKNSISWYQEKEFLISRIRFFDIKNSNFRNRILDMKKWFLDIRNSNFWYQEMCIISWYQEIEFLISRKTCLDIRKCISWYQEIEFLISRNAE